MPVCLQISKMSCCQWDWGSLSFKLRVSVAALLTNCDQIIYSYIGLGKDTKPKHMLPKNMIQKFGNARNSEMPEMLRVLPLWLHQSFLLTLSFVLRKRYCWDRKNSPGWSWFVHIHAASTLSKQVAWIAEPGLSATAAAASLLSSSGSASTCTAYREVLYPQDWCDNQKITVETYMLERPGELEFHEKNETCHWLKSSELIGLWLVCDSCCAPCSLKWPQGLLPG